MSEQVAAVAWAAATSIEREATMNRLRLVQARSLDRFPSLAPPSCVFHANEGVRCTPMDCENWRRAPMRDSLVARVYIDRVEREVVSSESEPAAIRPRHLKSVPVKKRGRR